ncbi:glutaredoxin [Puccinia sorghi]|uniref:Glutaredoxin n=1 Tax=Puccinia sorghi TaxID=27349 RepID=A0A0L6U6T3_9BASI|nr:glutaredoxin [Puccinia sorghi]
MCVPLAHLTAHPPNHLLWLLGYSAVVVFSKSTCPYCVKAIQTLKDLGQSPKVVELDEVTEGGAQHEYLKKKTGQRTVPAIFIKTQFIGGNSDLQALHAKNQLKPLL